MIKSFRHKGLQQFFETGSKAGISSEHEAKLAKQLLLLMPPKLHLKWMLQAENRIN
jgi:proteic killer suppression protein